MAGNSSFTFNLEVSGMLMKRSSVDLNFVQENGEKRTLVEVKKILTSNIGIMQKGI